MLPRLPAKESFFPCVSCSRPSPEGEALVKQIVLLSGSIGSGKTTLCQLLDARFRTVSLKTKEVIKELARRVKQERRALQRYGESLDRRTNGQWVRDALTRA